ILLTSRTVCQFGVRTAWPLCLAAGNRLGTIILSEVAARESCHERNASTVCATDTRPRPRPGRCESTGGDGEENRASCERLCGVPITQTAGARQMVGGRNRGASGGHRNRRRLSWPLASARTGTAYPVLLPGRLGGRWALCQPRPAQMPRAVSPPTRSQSRLAQIAHPGA